MVDPKALFALKKPCANCPFLKQGGIELRAGRLQGIIDNLIEDDHSTFQCHKTVHSKRGGEWDGEGVYQASGKESMCAGALIYLEKARRPTVAMRIGRALGIYDPAVFESHLGSVIEPDGNVTKE